MAPVGRCARRTEHTAGQEDRTRVLYHFAIHLTANKTRSKLRSRVLRLWSTPTDRIDLLRGSRHAGRRDRGQKSIITATTSTQRVASFPGGCASHDAQPALGVFVHRGSDMEQQAQTEKSRTIVFSLRIPRSLYERIPVEPARSSGKPAGKAQYLRNLMIEAVEADLAGRQKAVGA